MRVVLYDHQPGLIDGESVIDLSPLLEQPAGSAPEAMRALIAQWTGVTSRLGAAAAGDLPRRPFDPALLGPPMPTPSKIVAAPVNYDDHRHEMAVEHTVAQLGVFLKAPSSIIGPGGTIVLPFAERRIDQEAELAIVIGAPARNVPVDRAIEYVFGYTCLIDVTLRGNEERSMRKSFDTFTPLGPWITTRDEVPDPDDLRVRCWVNGTLRQDCSTSALICDVRHLIAYTSSIMTLEPGDIVSTGTPAGVGPLADGDRVCVEIDAVGRLEVAVADHDRSHGRGSSA
ncbi:hypothetical protein BH18ACT3_BH18ACT3_15380 [soil metagenome]